MASPTPQLLDLQRLDTEFGQLTRQLQQTDAGLADRLQERAVERAISQAEALLQVRQREQRDREFELARIEAQIKEHEQRLYSGKGSPRDLEVLQRDVELEHRRGGDLEEQVLMAMDATEAARQGLDRIKSTSERVLGEAAVRQRQLSDRRRQLQDDLARVQARRTQLVTTIDPGSLALYDRLRQRLPDGLAVAEVLQGRCEGCHTTLPSAEVQRARRSDTVVQCSVCQRILHVPHG